MHMYPVFLNLNGSRITVAGAGTVGRRKILGLLAAEPAEIFVVDPCPPSDGFREQLGAAPVVFAEREFEPADITGRLLVFAATDDSRVNSDIAELCRRSGVLCSIADAPQASAFHVPATVRCDELLCALSTGGNSPALARRMGQELQALLQNRYAPMHQFMRRLRPLILGRGTESDDNAVIFRALVDSALPDLLARAPDAPHADRYQAAEALVRTILPQELHQHIALLLEDL